MIRDDPDGNPAAVKQAFDAFNEGFDLQVEVFRQVALERMPQVIELAGFGPSSRFRTDWH